MAASIPQDEPGFTELPPTPVGAARGVAVFASILLALSGLMQIMQGLGAIANDDFYVVRSEYIYDFDVTAWGWLHLILGAVAFAVGMVLLSGALWARLAAITLAVLSILVNFAWLPYFPLWAISIMVIDVLIIWGVTRFDGY